MKAKADDGESCAPGVGDELRFYLAFPCGTTIGQSAGWKVPMLVRMVADVKLAARKNNASCCGRGAWGRFCGFDWQLVARTKSDHRSATEWGKNPVTPVRNRRGRSRIAGITKQKCLRSDGSGRENVAGDFGVGVARKKFAAGDRGSLRGDPRRPDANRYFGLEGGRSRIV